MLYIKTGRVRKNYNGFEEMNSAEESIAGAAVIYFMASCA